jgi:hypothetical protein
VYHSVFDDEATRESFFLYRGDKRFEQFVELCLSGLDEDASGPVDRDGPLNGLEAPVRVLNRS